MLNVHVATKAGSARFQHAGGTIEFGREPREGTPRHVLKDPYVSADQLRVLECPGGARVRVENLSRKVAVTFPDAPALEPGGARECALPVRLRVGESEIELASESAAMRLDEADLGTIAQPVLPGRQARALPGLDDAPGAEQLTHWFETLVAVQRAAASSGAFYRETARAVVDLVGLDFGLIVLRRDGDWKVVEQYPSDLARSFGFSRTILDRVASEKRTFFQAAAPIDPSKSMLGVNAVVASPIFGGDCESVVGAVYGARTVRAGRGGLFATEVRPIEAQLVQVLATAVASGLARVEVEAEATRQHAQFEQFFSRELALELDRDPTLLEGRDRVVTILMSDIRGFSRIAERIGPREACRLIVDVFEPLTARIQEQGGVVVDYIGDGLIAMWNAPIEQPDHGLRACRAALAMLGELPALNGRWQGTIGEPLRIGVGVNTGEALVGNIGCRRKFKYGPLGHTVNLASRVEGATKAFGVPILITGPTHDQVAGALATRRLGRVRVVGIAGAVELHELHAERMTPELQDYRDAYESALAHFEAGRWGESCRILSGLIAGGGGQNDLPTLALAARAIDCLRNPGRPFEPIVELSTK